jgi:hypothetical protein
MTVCSLTVPGLGFFGTSRMAEPRSIGSGDQGKTLAESRPILPLRERRTRRPRGGPDGLHLRQRQPTPAGGSALRRAPAIVAEGITINRTMLAELHGLVGTG